MDSQRSFLIIALAIVSFFLWQEWQKDYGPQPAVAPTQISATSTGTTDGGMASLQLESPETAAVQAATASSQLVKVITDTLELQIDTRGGNIVSLKLPQYALTKDSTEPYVLMRQLAGFEYVAQSGLIARDGPDRTESPVYQAANTEYRLSGDGTLTVPLRLEHNGMLIEKRFIFTAGKYDVRVEHHIVNNSTEVKTVQPFQHLRQNIDNGESSSMFMPIYRGAAFGSSEERYKKYDFSDMQKNNLNVSTQAGWVAMLEHYFVSAWIPDQQANNQLYSRITGGNKGVIGALGPVVDIDPGQSVTLGSTFYAGPVIRNKADLTGEPMTPDLNSNTPVYRLSAKTGAGIDALREHLKQCIGFDASTEGSFLARRRHLDALDRAAEHLSIGQEQLHSYIAGEILAEELRLTQQHLNEITGEFSSDDLLGRIFSSFCIGK
ncbi:membrane protein insertase YidC [Alishewanella longhuensis]